MVLIRGIDNISWHALRPSRHPTKTVSKYITKVRPTYMLRCVPNLLRPARHATISCCRHELKPLTVRLSVHRCLFRCFRIPTTVISDVFIENLKHLLYPFESNKRTSRNPGTLLSTRTQSQSDLGPLRPISLLHTSPCTAPLHLPLPLPLHLYVTYTLYVNVRGRRCSRNRPRGQVLCAKYALNVCMRVPARPKAKRK